MFCSMCGAKNEPTARFCQACGRAIGGQVPPAGHDAAMRALLPVGRSGWAIAAGYLGLVSLCLLPAPVSLVVSAIALKHLGRHPELYGRGRAWFGLVMGLLGTVLLVLLATGVIR